MRDKEEAAKRKEQEEQATARGMDVDMLELDEQEFVGMDVLGEFAPGGVGAGDATANSAGEQPDAASGADPRAAAKKRLAGLLQGAVA